MCRPVLLLPILVTVGLHLDFTEDVFELRKIVGDRVGDHLAVAQFLAIYKLSPDALMVIAEMLFGLFDAEVVVFRCHITSRRLRRSRPRRPGSGCAGRS